MRLKPFKRKHISPALPRVATARCEAHMRLVDRTPHEQTAALEVPVLLPEERRGCQVVGRRIGLLDAAETRSTAVTTSPTHTIGVLTASSVSSALEWAWRVGDMPKRQPLKTKWTQP